MTQYCPKEKMATFWSTSRNELWIKGKTSETTWRLLRFALTVSRTPFYIVKYQKEKGLAIQRIKVAIRTGCYYRTLTESEN